jgi:hypothetical protein
MNTLNNEIRELSFDELDKVAGGLQDNKGADKAYQRAADQIDGHSTPGGNNSVGGSLEDGGSSYVVTGGSRGNHM